VGNGPKMGQSKFDCACVFVVFIITPLVFYHPYIKPVGPGSIDLFQARLKKIIRRAIEGSKHCFETHYLNLENSPSILIQQNEILLDGKTFSHSELFYEHKNYLT